MQESGFNRANHTRSNRRKFVSEYLLELDFLARTAGSITVKQFTQKLPTPDNKTFLGKGKTEQVREFVEENEIDMIIFDDDLSTLAQEM